MPVYTVHAPTGYGTDVRVTPEKVTFVRDGFYVWAFLLAPLWLLWHRLWLALIVYLVVQFGLERGLHIIGASSGTRFFVMLILALFMGLEAGTLRRWKLSRGKWRQIDVVAADDEETAERRFFNRSPGVPHPVPPSLPPLPRSSLATQDASGFFPMPGSSQ